MAEHNVHQLVALDSLLYTSLAAPHNLIPRQRIPPLSALIKSRQGKNRPIGRSMAYKMMNKLANDFDLKEIGCHTLRKTFGYFFYEQTKDVAMLMKLFNHSSEKVTLRYIGIEQDTMDTALKCFKI